LPDTPDSIAIALDAMGGDLAPDVVIEAAEIARTRHPEARFLLFGDEGAIAPKLASLPGLSAVSEVRHTPDRVADEDKPSQALRKGKNTSMRLAVDAVRDGDAAGVVSAGNTGALMAMGKVVLKTLHGIERPALASFIPTINGECMMLDLGANIECDAENLVQFALMGADFYRAVTGVRRPTVGLLNVGVEELKGNETVKAAGQILRESELPFEFAGFIEGDDITKGTTNVVVTDGFTGNVALKTAEGAARMFAKFLGSAFRSSLSAKVGYLLAKSSLAVLRESLDPGTYNGAVFLGVNGIVVKSHGSADAEGYANAITLTFNMAKEDLIGRIVEDFETFSIASLIDVKAAAS
jgi:glycerol-3-phosphate acyltransferase PlsX